jgi:hypothetical protein
MNIIRREDKVQHRPNGRSYLHHEIVVEETLESLVGHYYCNRALYWTPGAHNPYWDAGARYMLDRCVATVTDFIRASGYDCLGDISDYDANTFGEFFHLTIIRPQLDEVPDYDDLR